MKSTGPTIVATKSDPASFNIAQSLIQQHGFNAQIAKGKWQQYEKGNLRLVIIEEESIYADTGDIPEGSTSIIFASRHRSNTQTPALTVHATGNLTKDVSYGGRPEEVSIVEPHRIHSALVALKSGVESSRVGLEVTMEATHHGPSDFPVPVLFVEIGSTSEQWANPVLGKIAADAVMAAASSTFSKGINAVGFGGTHYPAKLTQVCLEGNYVIGHAVSRYAFDAQVSPQVLLETFKKTKGVCKTAVVDWKGLKGEQRRKLVDEISRWNIEPVRA